MNSGIYRITNQLNENVYIGSAINFKQRKHKHFTELNMGIHVNKHLQSAYNIYGKERFKFDILLYCDKENLIFYEQRAIDILKPKYNIRKIADSNTGVKHYGIKPSEETKIKMSNSHKGFKHKEEAKQKMSLIRGFGKKAILTDNNKLCSYLFDYIKDCRMFLKVSERTLFRALKKGRSPLSRKFKNYEVNYLHS